MNLRDLQYLVAVADNLHFGKAAEACHVSQPTLSMQLKKLEEHLGVQLFERTNKTVMLTGIGETITMHARFILDEAENIRAIAKMAEDPFAGEIKLGIFPTLAPYILPALMPQFKTEFPELNVLLVEEKTPELVRRLNNGDIDCAMLAIPAPESNLVYTTLFEEPFMLAVSSTSSFARFKSVSLSQIKDEILLLLEDGHCLREQALDVCRTIGIGEANNFRATSMTTLLQMVAMGNYITLVPRLATTIPNESIRYIPFNNPAPSRTIGMFSRTTSARNKLVRRMADIIDEVYRKI